MSLPSRLFLILSIVAAAGLALGADTSSAELSLEQRCIAAGLVPSTETRGSSFNHHPEKSREVRATDNFLAPAEIDTSFEAIVADLPAACRGHFSRPGQIKFQFKASRGGAGWHSIRKGWEEIHWSERYLDPPKPTLVEHQQFPCGSPDPEPPGFIQYDTVDEGPTHFCDHYVVDYPSSKPPLSPFVSFASHQNVGSLGLGCATASRARIKLMVIDDATKAIVAVRFLAIPIPVESWYMARCQGKFSIQDSGAARRCPKQAIGGLPGGPPMIWGVKIERVGCAKASAIAQKALGAPAFSQGVVSSQRIGGWQCFYAQRGAAACLQGRKRVYLIARKGVREKCAGAPRGIKRLSVARTSCDVASGLATQVQQDPEALGPHQLGSTSWSCSALRRLDQDDRATFGYHCFAGEAMVAFEVIGSKLAPIEPTSIPPEVILPGSGPAALFALTPEMNLEGGTKWTRTKVLLPLEVEPALVGRKAKLELVESKAECTWTADAGQDTPICPTSRRIGTSRRTILLKASQMVYFAPRKHRGNWLYRLTIETQPFTYNGLNYRRTSHVITTGVINDAANCEINPWCHPNKRGDNRD